ncbi:MAG: VWA domain-containing protein, partial [Myxococcota bacterium]
LNGLDSVRDVELEPGETEIEFRSVVRVAGPVTYRTTLAPSGESERSQDRFAANNEYETSVVVPGKPTVLYVEGAQGRGTYLARALSAAEYDVDVRGPRAIPTSLRELERYDFFVLSDVSADQVTLSQMDAIERYVRDLGGGFLMAGGERAFGLGGWQGTRMERLLPVRMDSERRRDQPSLALTLVMDRSGSMNGPKLELAKEAAKATAELLSADDYISVVGFDSRPERIVRMQSARNRLRINRDIGRLTARGGTAIFPALDMAYQDLAVTRARIKHVILLTDGQAPDRGITELVQVMRAEGMTVSTVGLGADVNRALLQSIANLGGGRSYLTSDPHNVPRIFMRETTTVARSAAVEEYFQPIVSQRADFLRGVNVEGAPFLHGYVATRAKPSPAQVILQSDLGEPILARWRVGLGWSMAWTPDVKNRWSVEWVRWRGFSRFWAQLVREHMRQKRRQRLDMQTRMQGDEVHVVVDGIGADDQFLNGLDSTLRIDGPMGARAARDGEDDPQLRRTRELPLRQTAPGRYEARFPMDSFGSFVITAQHRREGRLVAESASQLANPYPAEYRTLEPDEVLLSAASEVTGGRIDPAPEALFEADGETIRAHKELWPWLLYFALGLFVLDLLLRRVRLFDREFRRG